jgi:hypothetical protein
MADDGMVVKLAGTMMDDTESVEADRVQLAAETRFEIGFEQAAGEPAGWSRLEGVHPS